MPTESDLVAYFQKHLVPIFISCKKGQEVQKFIVTSFVLSVKNQWFLITAGHCISAVNQLINEHGFEISNCYLIDSLGLDAKYYEPIPFDFVSSEPACLSESVEFDYGIILLSAHFRSLLEANNIQPLNEEVWKKQPAKIDFYALLGVPNQLTNLEIDKIEFTTTLHRIDALDNKPEGFPVTDLPLFYGNIVLGDSMTDIAGMSGGPILGFYRNE
ncbi:MAG: hypothetical protein ABFD50_14310, partial [Smithella sp.]